MDNQPVKQFMTLTEQPIAGTQISVDESALHSNHTAQDTSVLPCSSDEEIVHSLDLSKTLKYRFLRFGSLLGVAIVVMMYVLHDHSVKKDFVPTSVTHHLTMVRDDLSQASQIPSLYLAATRQALYKISLQKAKIAMLEEFDSDAMSNFQPLTDKVLVIPKSFG